jgi:pyrimidine operon attenuation protein / uracil phosphoribosyltransferase
MSTERTRILNERQIDQKITRMANQILENHYKSKKLFFVGIRKQGVPVAQRLIDELKLISDIEIELLEIELIKDKPLSEEVILSGDLKTLKNQVVIVVDDVLNSGRTLMYAVGYLLGAAPKSIGTAVLVERIHRRFPVRADYVGLTLSTNMKEHVSVQMRAGRAVAYLEE